MSFAVIVELATLIAYVVVILGGKQKRDVGWKIILSLLALAAVVQLVGMSMVVCGRTSTRPSSGLALIDFDTGIPLRP